MESFARSRPVIRVSSHAIKSTSDRISEARADKSLKLPIGVATKYKVPEPVATGFTDQELAGTTIKTAR